MLSYCTVDEILSVAPIFKKDVIPASSSVEVTVYNPNTRTITRAEVEDIALEASEMCRNMLQPQYDPIVIDSYDPLFPPIVNFIAKTIGARLMYERYPSIDPAKVKDYVAQLETSMQSYRLILAGNNLRDALGVLVPATSGGGRRSVRLCPPRIGSAAPRTSPRAARTP